MNITQTNISSTSSNQLMMSLTDFNKLSAPKNVTNGDLNHCKQRFL